MSIETQSAEFDAVADLAKAYRSLPAVVDDDYPEMRHYYERAIQMLLVAMRQNGRLT